MTNKQINLDTYYQGTVKELQEQVYNMYKRIQILVDEKKELADEVERLSKLKKL